MPVLADGERYPSTRAIGGDYSRPYEDRREAAGALVAEFVKELQTL